MKKEAPIFGSVTCGSEGYYYVVTGKENKTDNVTVNNIFVSRYNSDGSLVDTIGDNGSSSLKEIFNGDYYTKVPFRAGNCDISVNKDYIAVNYAREMYSGHQSNSVLVINRHTMQKEQGLDYYNSHSFAQRVIPYEDGFLLASEGDAYNRAFTISLAKKSLEYSWECTSYDIFHFWLQKGKAKDMGVVNDNFAHMGGIAVSGNNNAALVATSAQSLDSKAKKENEQLFIQIFKPEESLDNESSYITTGVRTGLSGREGTEEATNYGVKWLTDYSKSERIENPQVITNDDKNYIVLFELYKKGEYQGIHSIIVNPLGEVINEVKQVSSNAHLNPCRMPVYANGKIWWVGNKEEKRRLYLYSYKI